MSEWLPGMAVGFKWLWYLERLYIHCMVVWQKQNESLHVGLVTSEKAIDVLLALLDFHKN